MPNYRNICLWYFSDNVALNKEAKQVTAGDDQKSGRAAVDGNTNSDVNNGFCAVIDSGDPDVRAWWYVDLGREYTIDRVIIYNKESEDESYGIQF